MCPVQCVTYVSGRSRRNRVLGWALRGTKPLVLIRSFQVATSHWVAVFEEVQSIAFC
jgi:hypothetical protein